MCVHPLSKSSYNCEGLAVVASPETVCDSIEATTKCRTAVESATYNVIHMINHLLGSALHACAKLLAATDTLTDHVARLSGAVVVQCVKQLSTMMCMRHGAEHC